MASLYRGLARAHSSVERLNFVNLVQQYGVTGAERFIEEFLQTKDINTIVAAPFGINFELSVEFYVRLAESRYLIFCMYDDENYFDVFSRYYGQAADLVLTNDYWAVGAYRRLGIHAIYSLLPEWDGESYHPVKVFKDLDVSFVGDCYKGDRMEYIRYLLDHNVRVDTFGLGSKHGSVSDEKVPEIFARSKINLNFTKTDALSWVNEDDPLVLRTRQVKARPMMCALVKAFCLSEIAPGLEVLFKDGKEIATFDSREELLAKVRFYLEHETERACIEENAYERARRGYVAEEYFVRMAIEVEKILSGIPKPAQRVQTIYLSDAFRRKRAAALAALVYDFLRQGRFQDAAGVMAHVRRWGTWALVRGFNFALWRRTVSTVTRRRHARVRKAADLGQERLERRGNLRSARVRGSGGVDT